MEKKNNEKIKDILLLGFVLISVGLVFSLWFQSLAEKDAESPYFYRGVPTLSNSYYATRTAVAQDGSLEAGTAIPEHKKMTTSTPTPSPVPSATLLITPEMDG